MWAQGFMRDGKQGNAGRRPARLAADQGDIPGLWSRVRAGATRTLALLRSRCPAGGLGAAWGLAVVADAAFIHVMHPGPVDSWFSSQSASPSWEGSAALPAPPAALRDGARTRRCSAPLSIPPPPHGSCSLCAVHLATFSSAKRS
ncbi:unnamed protein product [Rangifer tarandus platyrhynchus]|uniref:Uncharacterized protein n=2 Tax=Rangifer tarandus platyrhynchus TaxID=3082113 RepID=A0ACB0E8G6_RANTA|nr:unnamed protein product [Rangifer tarandus platyrhynchus]CAI9696691.1 unnamed protein product [Rangifer tarandus platyrhynchus]